MVQDLVLCLVDQAHTALNVDEEIHESHLVNLSQVFRDFVHNNQDVDIHFYHNRVQDYFLLSVLELDRNHLCHLNLKRE